ncbi:tyrosine-protein phosphatase [Spirosoma foliorum]|uniref:protein-tyrosine-phosphatase n=1 Tax=Spirosoma foliorum TaxID=2710596 RepID=A0A7G5H2C0_9BACT|nr:CpsB/CapC family capsule biosynthesis tyrosine phosphatase [Spirosoma foliorum]QMW05262.1 histidinol-phosphatase [Spirosoma foliorum]
MNRVNKLLSRLLSLFRNQPGSSTEPPTCYWQTDIHSHFLPGVDDGVNSQEEALICLQQFSDWGIRRIITTPHVSQDWYPNTKATLLDGQAMLQALVNEHQIPLVVEVAAEYQVDELFLDLLRDDQLLSFGSQKYVLFETGWAAAPTFLNEIIFHLLTQGYQPLLAHPERYTYYHNDLKALSDLRKAGCLFQLNWGSMTGRYGRKVQAQAHRLLTNKWVDFMGSDIHRPADLSLFNQLVTSADYPLLAQQPLRNQALFDELNQVN